MGIVVTVLGLGLLIAAHELGHLILARLMGMRVETYSLGFGPRIWGFKRGDTDYRLSALPLGGYCRIAGFTPDDPAAQDENDQGSYVNKPAWRRFLVIAAGPGVNYLAAFVLLALLFSAVGTPIRGHMTANVQDGGPAARAGMRTGDELVSIDGARIGGIGDVIAALGQKGAPEVRKFEVLRGSERLTLDVRPENGKVQIGALQTYAHAAMGDAIARAASEVAEINRETLQALWNVVRLKGTSALSGPIGIVQQGAAQARRGAADFIALLAQISVGLAIFNFLPVPALDGGRLVFLGYELVTRRKVNQKAETVVHLVGFLLLFALVIAVTLFGDLQLGKKLFHRG
jgi:regulator of sigma E protease